MRFSFPITKIEKQADGSLLVGGCATDESIDSQGDILDFDGSVKAFGGWRGNVREAHDPKKPVGKALNVTFDDTRKAIDVEAFISAGAPETQQKLLDGVLRSFSVGGGNPTKVRMEKVGDKMVRRVLEWPMSELSVVDVGANPNANIELVKADGVATEALAAAPEATPAVVAETAAVVPEPNRFAEKLMKAVEMVTPPTPAEAPETAKADEPETKKDDMALADDPTCAKCMKVHKDGVEACMKEDVAAADTARAKKGIDEAKAKHKIAQAKEDLVAAKSKLDAVKGVGEKDADPDADGEDAASSNEPDPEGEAKKAVEAEGVKKSFEEWDIKAALEILEGLKALYYNETLEPEAEPPAQMAALESAIASVKAFIVSEAGELAATGADGEAVEAAAKPNMVKTFAAALDARDARLFAAFTKSQTTAPAAPEGLFKVTDGDQLAEGIGKGLSSVVAPIAKAQVELKDFIEVELKGVRKSIVDLGKTAAVPMPLRTVPREDIVPRRVINNEVEALEKALATATHPEAQVHLRQQIAIAKARPQG